MICPECRKPKDASHVSGRPDLGPNHRDFGNTSLKKFAPFVYSLLGGMLVHRVLAVEAHWYEPASAGVCLTRLASPRLNIKTVCGQTFYAGRDVRRAQACAIPKPEAVHCGRCEGRPAPFRRGVVGVNKLRREARQRIGCVMEVA